MKYVHVIHIRMFFISHFRLLWWLCTGKLMKFYTKQHQYTCAIDLHARSLYVCILDDAGKPVVHKQIKALPQALLKLIAPYQSDVVIGVECMFSSALTPVSPYLLNPFSRVLPSALAPSVALPPPSLGSHLQHPCSRLAWRVSSLLDVHKSLQQ